MWIGWLETAANAALVIGALVGIGTLLWNLFRGKRSNIQRVEDRIVSLDDKLDRRLSGIEKELARISHNQETLARFVRATAPVETKELATNILQFRLGPSE